MSATRGVVYKALICCYASAAVDCQENKGKNLGWHAPRMKPGLHKADPVISYYLLDYSMEYTCRKGLKTYSYQLDGDSVNISVKGLLDSEEYQLPLESIGDRKVVGVYATDSAFVSSVFCILFAIILLVFESDKGFLLFGFIGLVSLMYGLATRQGIVTVSVLYGENIRLYFTRNKKTEAVEFADTLISKARSFAKVKYSNFDRQMPLEKQFDNLEYLKDRNLVSSDEYNDIKNYLLGNEKRSIGFKQ